MAEKHLDRKPHHPQNRPDVWWYEENDGIYILMTGRGENQPVENTCKIKWSSLRAALARKDKEDDDTVKNKD